MIPIYIITIGSLIIILLVCIRYFELKRQRNFKITTYLGAVDKVLAPIVSFGSKMLKKMDSFVVDFCELHFPAVTKKGIDLSKIKAQGVYFKMQKRFRGQQDFSRSRGSVSFYLERIAEHKKENGTERRG